MKDAPPQITDPTRVGFRPASAQDFEYCKRLYFSGSKRIIEELHLDRAAQAVIFARQWAPSEVRIITLDGSDAGWLQTSVGKDGIFVAQLFVDGPFQGQGIGTEVLSRVIANAAKDNLAVRLGVVKINPALRLYERLGFHITHDDDLKFYMERDPVTDVSLPGRPSAG